MIDLDEYDAIFIAHCYPYSCSPCTSTTVVRFWSNILLLRNKGSKVKILQNKFLLFIIQGLFFHFRRIKIHRGQVRVTIVVYNGLRKTRSVLVPALSFCTTSFISYLITHLQSFSPIALRVHCGDRCGERTGYLDKPLCGDHSGQIHTTCGEHLVTRAV
jgi:hypothetical protein